MKSDPNRGERSIAVPEPKSVDLLDEEISTSNAESSGLICKASDARASAAYWQGRCEGLELLVDRLGESHETETSAMRRAHEALVEQMRRAHELTTGYLKDRLNRLEAPRAANP